LRKIILEQSGFEVVTASNGVAALAILNDMSVDVAVLDFEMPEMDGASLAAGIRDRLSIPIVIVSGFSGNLPGHLQGLCQRVIPKGEAPSMLIDTLRRLTAYCESRESEAGVAGDTVQLLRVA
jgi:CheY-like chemotaxis protein